ncbi:hypothetical protein [Rhodococcus opacus]|uniref:hypothetical protein n=1 Tax=Rhodococcus opacus TaxID=37919 RepID=UPI001CEC6DEE|nr:hypothetical protein [Rhodococcus opacus]
MQVVEERLDHLRVAAQPRRRPGRRDRKPQLLDQGEGAEHLGVRARQASVGGHDRLLAAQADGQLRQVRGPRQRQRPRPMVVTEG